MPKGGENVKYIWILAFCISILAGCAAAPEPEVTETTLPAAKAAAVIPLPVEEETVLVLSLEGVKPYAAYESMTPDTVPADTMGDLLCDTTLPGGANVLCYWEPDSRHTKYWAIRRGDELLRFCMEDACYDTDYSAAPFTDVLGCSGFVINAPRGAAYTARDYYIYDETGVPRLLAGCSGEPLEADVNEDGERELLWFYHGGREVYYFYHREGALHEADIISLLHEQYPEWLLLSCTPKEYTGGKLPVTFVKGGWDAVNDDAAHHAGWLEFSADTVEVHIGA